MEQLVKWLDSYINLLCAIGMHLLGLLTAAAWLALLRLASSTNGHVKLSNLVSILAWCGYLDWTGPVEVEVAEGVRQLLDVHLGEVRLVEWHVEVGWQDASLVG